MMGEATLIIFLLQLLLIISSNIIPSAGGAATYSITDHGASPDGRTDSTKPFLSAWSLACGSDKPSTIYVPKGKFLVGEITFNGPCRSPKTTIQLDGTLVAPMGYSVFRKDWILFDDVNDVSIKGGEIDAQGSPLWACKAFGRRNCPKGPSSLVFETSKNVVIDGLASTNAKLYHIVINRCKEVKIHGVRIRAPENSKNTDGIHVQMSQSVVIADTDIGTGDDCISIGPGTDNLWIERIRCGPGHGVSIGSLGKSWEEEGVQNVTVTTATFTSTSNGVRIKTWGRPSTGFVRGVVFQHLLMENVRNPIIITQHYCESSKACPHQDSGVKISGVTYKDIKGSSSGTAVAIGFDCSPSNPCSDLIMQDINLVADDAPAAKSLCKHAYGQSFGEVVPGSCLS